MEDIDQSRFALITALTEAHKARPNDYPNPGTVLAMSDEGLRAYAIGLLQLLDGAPGSDRVETALQQELRLILHETPKAPNMDVFG
jgi:hypothetical protein